MNRDIFNFFIYRINKEFRYDLFSPREQLVKNHDDILKNYLKSICIDKFDIKNETKNAKYSWSLRRFIEIDEQTTSIVLAKSELSKDAFIVTNRDLTTGITESSPAPAQVIAILFFWERHLAIVENRSGMATGVKHYHKIVDNSKSILNTPVIPRLEPVPLQGSIREHLKKFDVVHRLRLKVRLPNPELSRVAKNIYNNMLSANIAEYLQEFGSPDGLKIEDGNLIDQAVSLAESGYKDGGVKIDGEKNGKPVSVDEGKYAIKGKIAQILALIRGIDINSRNNKALKDSLLLIRAEVNRLFPNEE